MGGGWRGGVGWGGGWRGGVEGRCENGSFYLLEIITDLILFDILNDKNTCSCFDERYSLFLPGSEIQNMCTRR